MADTANEIKRWDQRVDWTSNELSTRLMVVGMKQEIAELRAALASRPAEVDDEGLPPLPQGVAVMTEFPRDQAASRHYTPYRPGWLGSFPPTGSMLYTAEQFRQGQRDAVAADRARREKLPANADDMVAFIGNHYNSMRDDKPDPNDIVYELTVHDLLSAFRWWFDEFELEDEPSHTTNKEK